MVEKESICDQVAIPNFPAYAVCCVGRFVIVAGGGGAAKTGVKNRFDVYELSHDGRQTTSECVLSHDVGEHCISNMCAWAEHRSVAVDENDDASVVDNYLDRIAPTLMIAYGREEMVVYLRLTPKLSAARSLSCCEDDMDPSGVRRRRHSSRSARGAMQGEEDPRLLRDPKTRLTFTVNQISVTETVTSSSSSPETYQKCVRVSPDHKFLVTGGTDGHIRIWSLPGMESILDLAAHEKEIDDLDVKPSGKQLVTVSKPNRECCIWSIEGGKKITQIALPTNGIKYRFFRARYGRNSNNLSRTRLFTISNPMGGGSRNPPPGLVAQWCGRTYELQKTLPIIGSTLSNLALNDDGNFLAVGTMGGDVHLLIAFSLQPLRIVTHAHRHFVTGLDFLSSGRDTGLARCNSEASVLSISIDNALMAHHVAPRAMLPVWFVALLAVIVLFVTFVAASYLDF